MEIDYKQKYEEAKAERERVEKERETFQRIHLQEMERTSKRKSAIKYFLEYGYGEHETTFLMGHFTDAKLDDMDADAVKDETKRLHELFQRTVIKHSAKKKRSGGLFRKQTKGAN